MMSAARTAKLSKWNQSEVIHGRKSGPRAERTVAGAAISFGAPAVGGRSASAPAAAVLSAADAEPAAVTATGSVLRVTYFFLSGSK